MMDYQLTIPALLRRAETFYGDTEIVSRRLDKTVHRYRYADMVNRAKQLAAALTHWGVARGDRVATLAWNHHRHLEAYFAIPAIGAALHTLNVRLHPEELAFIVNHAGDRVLFVDYNLLPIVERFRARTNLDRVIVMDAEDDLPAGVVSYDALVESSTADSF